MKVSYYHRKLRAECFSLFTKWVEQNEPNWSLGSIVENSYPYDAVDAENTSFSDFYVFVYRGCSVGSGANSDN
jgi:hypothetical protein